MIQKGVGVITDPLYVKETAAMGAPLGASADFERVEAGKLERWFHGAPSPSAAYIRPSVICGPVFAQVLLNRFA